ncbi:hypothetical protein NDU88_004199 [Pleurodeles waltl]|uniref:Myb/SANT-like DNA-binding domain-containing protein n=1 Tax=Pleurodeles waltl TaxID=8319 RepID=A0AAV7SI35_PLEWA|nr:hypothetical protein NDU88_004199 [Pleurodeles waltl]
MELWRRIVDRVNAVGQHLRTRDDIRKMWNDLRGKGPQGTPRTQDNQGAGVSGSGHTVQGTEAQDNRDTGRTAVQQGEDRPRDPTLQEALTEFLGAYQHSQVTLDQILVNMQENRRLEEGQYQGIREDLQAINTTLVSIAEVLAKMANIMREAAL